MATKYKCSFCNKMVDEIERLPVGLVCGDCQLFNRFLNSTWRCDLRMAYPDAFPREAGWGSHVVGWTYNLAGPNTPGGWVFPGSPGWIIQQGHDTYIVGCAKGELDRFVGFTIREVEYELYKMLSQM